VRLKQACGHQMDATKGPKCQIHCAECSLINDNVTNNSTGKYFIIINGMLLLINVCPADVWKTIRGKFFMVSGANLSCSCPRSPNGIAPFCHVGNGCADIVLVKRTNLFNNLRLLLRLSSSTKTLVNFTIAIVYFFIYNY